MSSCWECDRGARWEAAGREAKLRQIAELERSITTLETEVREHERTIARGDTEVAAHRADCPETR